MPCSQSSKKYELTDDTICFEGRTLYRIRALRDIRFDVKEGALGGYIQSEDNLSQDGLCWIYDSAKAFDDTRVRGNADIGGNAVIRGNADIGGNAIIGKSSDYIVVHNIGSRSGNTTFYRTKDGIGVNCGCFNGSIGKFESRVREKHAGSKHESVYLLSINLAKVQLENET